MKKNPSLTNMMVACVIACAMVSTVVAQTEGVAKVVRIKGDARYMVAGGSWQTAKVGTVLKPGSVIETSREKGAFVDLVLGEGGGVVTPPSSTVFKPFIPSSMAPSASYQPSAEQNIVRVWENSALGIDKLTTTQTGADVVSETQLDLKMGRIIGNVKKMSAASRFEVKLPNGVAGIRGTFFDIVADGIVRVVVGSMVLAWVTPDNNTHTQVIGSNQQFDSRSGQLTPIGGSDLSALNGMLFAMQMTRAQGVETSVQDKTVIHPSPVGPPFTPPGPPPVIPPGRGVGPG